MFDLGEEELTIENYRIPWLIWIQLIVLFLLLLILFCFALLPSDPHHDAMPTTTSSTSYNDIQQIDKQPLLPNHDSTPILVTNHMQGGQNLSIRGEIATGSSMRREEITEGESSSLNFHPCHYFQLATVAFLKCFGLDSRSDSSPSTPRHMKRKES